jgi:predicted nicotinamide N-methyase
MEGAIRIMSNFHKKEIFCYGVHALSSRHREIRLLKRMHAPHRFGFRVWTSSWLLMDFIKRHGLPIGTHVMELGCGWGLAGIYCAKMHQAVVTGVDIDPEVFYYLRYHSEINAVHLATMNMGFEELGPEQLNGVKVLIGADICFWDTMAETLKKLICRAFAEGVQLVVLADPGREPFDQLCEYFADEMGAETLNWSIEQPYAIEGRILKISSFN